MFTCHRDDLSRGQITPLTKNTFVMHSNTIIRRLSLAAAESRLPSLVTYMVDGNTGGRIRICGGENCHRVHVVGPRIWSCVYSRVWMGSQKTRKRRQRGMGPMGSCGRMTEHDSTLFTCHTPHGEPTESRPTTLTTAPIEVRKQ